MSSTKDVRPLYTRRDLLSTTLGIAGAGAASLLLPDAATAGEPPPSEKLTYNGSTDPYPIPWLDKFGDHHQPAGPTGEPSDIYHFKGRIVRCADFVGVGTDNSGNRIAFGAPSTDFGIMQGEYFAARAPQNGAFVHI